VGDLSLSLVIARFLDRKERRPAGLPSLVGPLFPFDPVAPRLAAADLAVGNLECVLSDRGEAPAGRMPLRCALGSLGPLRAAGFDLVSVANNHAFDFGSGAFADMLRRLDQGGLAHVGAASYSDQPQAPACFDLGGASPRRVEPGAARAGGLIRVGVLAYNTPGRRALADVAAARGALDVLVVFPHWGAEDHAAPTPLQIARARELIDAGADLVVGTHAHVVQPTTWHRGKLVAYGLGNFVFPGMDDSEAHRTGALLEVEAERAAPGGPVALVAHRILRTRIDGVAGVPRLVGEPVELTAP
jgi:poly-gamma-glutamate synthesis protein (capsule biosynthesis protein)